MADKQTMKRILSALFDAEFPARDQSAETELTVDRLFLRSILAGLFVSAPAWLSGFSALFTRAIAFLF